MAPPQSQASTWRYVAALVVIVGGLYALVFFTGDRQPTPRLGLDLIGGTTLRLTAVAPDGQAPPEDQLEEARNIIQNRVDGLGVAEAEVVTEGANQIVISVPGSDDESIRQVGEPAQLRFREVLAEQPAVSAVPAPSPSAVPSGSVSPAPSGPASPAPGGSASPAPAPSDPAASPAASPAAPPAASPAPSPSGEVAAPAGSASPGAGSGGGELLGVLAAPAVTPAPAPGATSSPAVPPASSPAVTPSPGASGSPTPSGSPSGSAAPAPQGAATLPPEVAELAPLVEQATPEQLAGAGDALAPFADLTGEQVALLSPTVLLNVPQISCDMLGQRPAGSIDAPDAEVVACDVEGTTKFRLGPASVLGTDVSNATAGIGQDQPGWQVVISFSGDGQRKWTDLTARTVGQRVAVVLDTEVVSAPTIQDTISGDAQITGSFTQVQAQTLASQLRYGALPLTFEQSEAQTISATLGTEQLRAGLLAGAVGVALIALYSFFYYRLLGSVILFSLLLSAGIVYACLVVLGRQIGFTLTLAGVAGFIVSLGIAADSFVIYFERLKDEIREGRTPRSAVARAWVRARRTIISANVVSFLAAAVLYTLAIGAVKGFALTLGLSTLIDLGIVFLFRHPMMVALARSRAFLSPRVSGLGQMVKKDEPIVPAPRRRPKEA